MVTAVMFTLGGGAYVALEMLWRGRSHISMFAAGGVCFLLLGAMGRKNRKPWTRAALGATAITAVELAAGLLVNRDWRVWDYRAMPGNLLGQVCLPYSALWAGLSLVAMALYPRAEKAARKALSPIKKGQQGLGGKK